MAALTDTEFVTLLEKHRHEFFRYVLRTVWNASVAEDVLSAAVLAAYQQLDHFEAGTNFRAWMYRILTNKCFVANRETRRSAIDIESVDEGLLQVDPLFHTATADDPEGFLERCGDEVVAAMRGLSSAERACLMLRTVEHLSYKEVAQVLDMPVGTVMTHLARGRARLRTRLTAYARQQGICKTLTTPQAPASPAAAADDEVAPRRALP